MKIMSEQIVKYFSAEKSESLLFMVVGLIAVFVSVYFFFQSKDVFYKGMIIPLVLIGLIQLVVGSTVFFRSDKDITKAETYLAESKEILKQQELPRMEEVMKNFQFYKWTEIGFIVAGIILLLVFTSFNYWKGLGLAMLIQGVFMLALDMFAEKRGADYIDWIKNL